MPILKRDDAEIYFEEFGNGYPLLLFAPGGMRSRIEMWHEPKDGPPRSWNDWTDELASRYRVVAMDQRNAGRSRGAILANHGWQTYAADHLALMEHLGFKRFHTLGGCIGSSFCLKLCEIVPERVTALTIPPDWRPNSALKLFVCTENSCSASGFGIGFGAFE